MLKGRIGLVSLGTVFESTDNKNAAYIMNEDFKKMYTLYLHSILGSDYIINDRKK